MEQPRPTRRGLRSSNRGHLLELSDTSDSERAATSSEAVSGHQRQGRSQRQSARTATSQRVSRSSQTIPSLEPAAVATAASSNATMSQVVVLAHAPSQEREVRRTFRSRRRRRGSNSALATPTPLSPGDGGSMRGGDGAFTSNFRLPSSSTYFDTSHSPQNDREEVDMTLNELVTMYAQRDYDTVIAGPPRHAMSSMSRISSGIDESFESECPDYLDEDDYSDDELLHRVTLSAQSIGATSHTSLAGFNIGGSRSKQGPMKRSREKFESLHERDMTKTLISRGAVSILLYFSGIPRSDSNDVWPDCRNAAKLPARYFRVKKEVRHALDSRTKRTNRRNSKRPTKILKVKEEQSSVVQRLPRKVSYIWPRSQLPTELYEEIAGYLNRDDIKAMRLACREFDRHVSQVLFKTVVVPFNTEIYGMLGQDQKPDLKGKKKVRVDNMGLPWKNADGDDVYNGHGLDVFRGFGQHIMRYGMSFEVNEDSLARPPEKSSTQNHTSFWGCYDWPFEEYRRFDDVAGLETAADETPRMKVAFSELSRVRELALSIDSGLGWLNGPDRSIRARILQRPPAVFGTPRNIPDRREQAQRELWDHIQACHHAAESNIKLANLYKIEINRSSLEALETNTVIEEQPEMPYLDPHLIHEAVPHDATDVPLPSSFEDPEILERFVLAPSTSGSGMLFSSANPPTEAGQLMSPIIPANLTKAQKEWLLETEWAQRAFLSSYMLAIMDNPSTFSFVHSLNISRLSDRYIGMLNRHDFWDALPSLVSVNLQVIPGYRTVNKDEAGFVDTPKISPSSGIDTFYELLRHVVARRKNIKKLNIGWVTGGEHAEGLHARNKLILPAPLLPAARIFDHDAATIGLVLLEFPFVEELTLSNCWITPSVLQSLVEHHDRLSLKRLVLNSVSLTAILVDHGNGHHPHHAQHVAGLLGAFAAANVQQNQQAQQNQAGQPAQQQGINPQQLLHMHIQTVQLQMQQLQAQANAHNAAQLATLQAQLQGQLHLQHQLQVQQQAQQQVHQAGQHVPAFHLPNFGALLAQMPQAPPVPVAPVANQQPVNPQNVLQAPTREGSWMYLLDILSPGLNLSDFGSEHSRANTTRSSSLECIQFISCGYARLPYVHYDQSAIEPQNPLPKCPTFTKKYNVLQPAMLSGKWPLLGEIVQEVDANELSALAAAWFLEAGWQDAEEAEAPCFDGCLPGGTGRFTGIVRKSDRVRQVS